MLRLCLASGGLLVINSSEPVRFTVNGDWERTPLRFTLRQLAPSISASIVQLEAEFGIQLFVRKHSQGLSLTPGGRFFPMKYPSFSIGRGPSRDRGGGGPLAIGCLMTFSQLVMPSLRAKFETAYPDVRVRQFERNQGQLFEMLRRGEIDVARTYDLDLT